MDIISILGFILLGVAVATLGTIIGAGGGIISIAQPFFLVLLLSLDLSLELMWRNILMVMDSDSGLVLSCLSCLALLAIKI